MDISVPSRLIRLEDVLAAQVPGYLVAVRSDLAEFIDRRWGIVPNSTVLSSQNTLSVPPDIVSVEVNARGARVV